MGGWDRDGNDWPIQRGPSRVRFRLFSPRAQIPRMLLRLSPTRSPIASKERFSAW